MWSGEDTSGADESSGLETGAESETDTESESGDRLQKAKKGRRRKPGNFRNRKVERSEITFSDFANPWNFYHIFLQDEESVHNWCREHGLLAMMQCRVCDGTMVLRKRKGSFANEAFRCNKNSSHTRQTREFSFFEGSKVPTNDLMLFIKSYLDSCTLLQCSKFAGVSYGSTAVDWAVYIRELFQDDFLRNLVHKKLKGEIEIDKSLFGRRVKYHKGNPNVGIKVWVFGMVERKSNSIILYPVNDRSEETLIPLIERHVEKGSTIYSDGWSAYCALNNRGYKHFTVLHKYAFKKVYVNVETKEEVIVHTNRIEGAWKHAKNHFRKMSGTLSSQFEGHLAEIMWRSRTKRKHLYEKFFTLLQTVYTLDGPPTFSYSRDQPLFDSWDGASKNSDNKEMVMPVTTDAESDVESSALSSVSSGPLPSILQPASSSSDVTQGNFQVDNDVIEISSTDSEIPPNRTRPDMRISESTRQALHEMFSQSQNSDSDNDQNKTLVEEPPAVARSKRSSQSSFRSEATMSAECQPDDIRTDPSTSVRPKKSAKEKRSKVARTGSTVTKKTTPRSTDLPSQSSQRSRVERTAKAKKSKEHVCHPPGFTQKQTEKHRRTGRSTAASNPYASKDAYQWSSDSDFQ